MIDVTISGELFHPNKLTPGIKIEKTGNSVTTMDGVTHVNGLRRKRTLEVELEDLSREEQSRLFRAVLTRGYFEVIYTDTMTNEIETRVFTLANDPTAPVKIWKDHLQYYELTVVSLLEKGAERIC